jgi:hypothetical protein
MVNSWVWLISSAVLSAGFGTTSVTAAPGTHLASAPAPLRIPFRLYNNHIYLQVSVNGSAPLWFVLDTGASNLIASRHAKALGLKLTPAPPAAGSGDGTQDAFTADNVSLALAGITLKPQKFGVLDFEELEACSNELDVDPRGKMTKRLRPRQGDERQPFDGVVGDEFFRLFVVELDFAAQVMTLHEPGTYQYSGSGEAIPLEVRPRWVYLRTQLASSSAATVSGVFLIDTGFMGALLLHRPFVEGNRLLPRSDETTPFALCGIGGESDSRMGALRSVRLGSFDVESPVTLFSQARDGNLTSTAYDGIIGNAILRHFNLVFDYSRSRMILEPRR